MITENSSGQLFSSQTGMKSVGEFLDGH